MDLDFKTVLFSLDRGNAPDVEIPEPDIDSAGSSAHHARVQAGVELLGTIRKVWEVEIEFIREMLARAADTVTSRMCRAAHPSGCTRCGAGAGCSAIKHQYLERF